MGMKGLLVVILSGPTDFERARQGLRAARNLKRGNMLDVVRVFLLGPGVQLLDRESSIYPTMEEWLKTLRAVGVPVAACAGNIRAYGLEEKIDKNLVTADDTAAAFAEAVEQGLTIATF